MRVVVLGGYGNFGARICRALARDRNIDLVVAGRDPAKARELADPLGASAAAIDAASPRLAHMLKELAADLVVHTAGPFQAQYYRVARASLEADCDYIDLADGRRFVCDFSSALDTDFRRAGKTAITGASTVPALSSAVVDALLPRFSQLQCIDTCIAPAQQAPRGVATLAGVLSYCGAEIQVWRDGKWQARRGWADPSPVRFARMEPRLGSLCDIPDLELFPQRYAGLRDAMFRAALEVRATQRAFAVLAWLHARGLLPRPPMLAGMLHGAGKVLDRFGSQLGAMVLRLQGVDAEGKKLSLAWNITAPGNHGPEIPCMAAILLARRLAQGERLPAGAMPCAGLLRLEDFQPEFDRWGMVAECLAEQPQDGLGA